ncbi:probable ubiquitin carboxyl-terminal hydrolase MINDY-4 isoform X2 [Tiliqua scincoides]|uniref:probable ubiquitin carboxyl-terminal hydrolase MINDY-4 isoform X2 n=1 Tax=Tiliqua scincoides TaxID=71010 RepID=UPI0034628BEB
MEAAFVEEVAASLVREFLSKKGLKKTSIMMDEEFPRTALSINNRNELRTVLHLQSLYKENKAKENPLKTILEIMTSYFLEHDTNPKSTKNPPVPHKTSQPRCAEISVHNSLPDEDTSGCALPETSRNGTNSYEIRDNITQPAVLPRRHLSNRSEKSKTEALLSHTSPTENKLAKNCEDLRTPEQALEARTAMREKFRVRPGLIARGMMAGPTATSQEDSLKRRHMKLSSSISSKVQLKGDGPESSFTDGFQDNKGTSRQQQNILSPRSGGSLEGSKDHSGVLLFGPFTSTGDEKTKHAAKGNEDPCAKPAPGRQQAEQRPESGCEADMKGKSHSLHFLQMQAGTGSQKREKKSEAPFSDCRKTPKSISSRGSVGEEALELVDVEDEATVEEVCKIFDPSTHYVLQVTSKPIDFFLARDLKTLLFGSSLGCFSEEWKIQSFAFSDIPQLKYGIVQKKGGPCGVLAAVQACVLRHLIFGDSHRNSNTWSLQTSEAHRTECLTLAFADILWRAGSREKAVVVLCTGTEQFTPAGKYKADGILETLMLHTVRSYEDLLKFLQRNIYQFEVGPYGCILLTLSVILSRSIDQVRGDFDVLTNRLIGAHGYCTQELINLMMTGQAVSNVFNDRVELDSGNGNITILKGVSSRSDVGLLSLFEHYDVSQVGCYLKTPKYPIWLVCSESHFSVLFCLEKDLLGDWKAERRFDLYYYDGLANQQEEIRLTIDTSQPYIEDKDNDLIPPLEHCIRTKWKGAIVNWNGTEPIL